MWQHKDPGGFEKNSWGLNASESSDNSWGKLAENREARCWLFALCSPKFQITAQLGDHIPGRSPPKIKQTSKQTKNQKHGKASNPQEVQHDSVPQKSIEIGFGTHSHA